MANNEMNNGNNVEMAVTKDQIVEKVAKKKEHRKMKPWVKWLLIGVGGAVLIGGTVFLIIHGKKVPVKEVAKVAPEIAEAATEAVALAA